MAAKPFMETTAFASPWGIAAAASRKAANVVSGMNSGERKRASNAASPRGSCGSAARLGFASWKTSAGNG